jgi:hypothetical protein
MNDLRKTETRDLTIELEIEELDKIVAPSTISHEPPDPC